MQGKLEQIDGGLVKTVYGTDSGQNVYKAKSKLYPVPDAKLTHVSVGQGGIWGVNAQGEIMFSGPPWQLVPGNLIQVDSGPAGVVYGVNRHHRIYYRDGILPSKETLFQLKITKLFIIIIKQNLVIYWVHTVLLKLVFHWRVF